MQRIQYLWYIVDEQGMHVDPSKIQVIHDWSTPMTLTNLPIFLGLTNLYHRFILGFFHIAWPLNKVTKCGSKANFVWDKPQHRECKDLKPHLCSTPILTLPNLQQNFKIEIGASNYAMSGVFTYHGHMMAYNSEALSDVVCKYPIYDNETYSIVHAYHLRKHYILGKHMIICNDQNPL